MSFSKRVFSNVTNTKKKECKENFDGDKMIRFRELNDAMDPIMYHEYALCTVEHFREMEKSMTVSQNFLDCQDKVNWEMRTALVDLLIDYHWRLNLTPETLFLTVSIIDRFLSKKNIDPDMLHLIGVTSLFIASKYEEVASPSIDSFNTLLDGSLPLEKIISAERYILHTLDYKLNYPSPLTFLRRCSKSNNYEILSRTLAKYFLELSLLYKEFIGYTPSMISATAFHLASNMLQKSNYTEVFQYYCGYTQEEIQSCLAAYLKIISLPIEMEFIQKKYSSSKFMKASVFVREYVEKHLTKRTNSGNSNF